MHGLHGFLVDSLLNVVNIFRNLEWRGESSFFRRFFTCFIVAITYVAPKPAAIKTYTQKTNSKLVSLNLKYFEAFKNIFATK